MNGFCQDLIVRRSKLLQSLPDKSLILLFSAKDKVRSNDTNFPFRQDSNFWYLSGVSEPKAAILCFMGQNGLTTWLFRESPSPHAETWLNPRTSNKELARDLAIDKIYDLAKLGHVLSLSLSKFQHLFLDLEGLSNKPKLSAILKNHHAKSYKLGQALITLAEIKYAIFNCRLIKSSYEINCLRIAIQISANAHLHLIKHCLAYKFEYQLAAEFNYRTQSAGCQFLAYESIVASGPRANILHYTANQHELRAEDLVLVDAGAEYQYYAADITRTYPVKGRFTKAQASIYHLVLDAQVQAIKLVKPGLPWSAIQERILKVLVQGLIDLKILKGELAELINSKAYLPYYMHSSGHSLGLDVHDPCTNQSLVLKAGMTLTIEPGLYLKAGTPGLDPCWQGIGVRIEDDILVTEQGFEVLSNGVPKEIKDLEQLMSVQCP